MVDKNTDQVIEIECDGCDYCLRYGCHCYHSKEDQVKAAKNSGGVATESPRPAQRHCSTCTCGLTHVEWSDREAWVNLADPEAVASIVMGCALDHSYDRTGDGIPYGFPEELRGRLAPVVARHLSAAEPDWENKSVYMGYDDGSRDAFRRDLLKAFNAPARDAGTTT